MRSFSALAAVIAVAAGWSCVSAFGRGHSGTPSRDVQALPGAFTRSKTSTCRPGSQAHPPGRLPGVVLATPAWVRWMVPPTKRGPADLDFVAEGTYAGSAGLYISITTTPYQLSTALVSPRTAGLSWADDGFDDSGFDDGGFEEAGVVMALTRSA